MRKNDHYDKASDKDSIDIFANTNTLKSVINNNCKLISGDLIQLIVS